MYIHISGFMANIVRSVKIDKVAKRLIEKEEDKKRREEGN